MIEIRGKFNTAICYTDILEETAQQQIQDMCDQRLFAGSRIRIMPDVHAGAGCTIGTTMVITFSLMDIIDGQLLKSTICQSMSGG